MNYLPLSLFGVASIVALLVVWAFVRHPEWLKKAPPRPPIKRPIVYWSCRIYTAIVFLGFLASWLATVATLTDEAFVRIFYCMPFFAVAILAVFNAFAFPCTYSVFGKRRRTPLPDEVALRTIENSWAVIGELSTGPFVTWLFYRQGVGMKIAFSGNVFLPWDEVEALAIQRGSRSILYHHCPEVRGPICLPQKVARVMAEMLGKYDLNKVLDAAQPAAEPNDVGVSRPSNQRPVFTTSAWQL